MSNSWTMSFKSYLQILSNNVSLGHGCREQIISLHSTMKMLGNQTEVVLWAHMCFHTSSKTDRKLVGMIQMRPDQRQKSHGFQQENRFYMSRGRGRKL